jgi:putative acyl-CoA dehydrogenase
MAATHEVTNQPPPLEGYDVFESDAALVEAVEREGAAWAVDDLHGLGRLAGSPEAIGWGFDANRHPPELHTHDRYGHRVDEVTYHPAYHELMQVAVGHGLHGAPWGVDRRGVHVARAAGFVTWSQVDAGHGCPISMTYSIVPALRNQPDLAEEWEPRLVARAYDPRDVAAREKPGALAGMGMTEKQGGSDVRANTTRAEPAAAAAGGPTADGTWRLTGHKWFCSAPMSDLFLMLAQAPGGLSCFLFEGRDPGFRIQRLKDKLGTRSLPSSEVEFHGVRGRLIGDEGRGVATIIRMVNHTRLDCLLGSAASMRWGLVQAVHHARHRSAFGKLLAEQPAMQNVLADLAVESEAATAAALRIARSYDDEREAPFRRFATAVMKYWVCKRAAPHAAEALECLGGNGYVEESGMPRLLRDAPLNSIWEGSGNVAALDVLRATVKEPEGLPALMAECELARGGNPRLDIHLNNLRSLKLPAEPQFEARRLVEDLALALQASLLVRHAPAEVADAFCAGRLGDGGRAFGTLPSFVDANGIVGRALAA